MLNSNFGDLQPGSRLLGAASSHFAVRWSMEGHHLGHGLLGPPSGQRVFLLGVSHLHVRDGAIVEEWTVYDELAMLTQVRLGQLAAA